jgi:hypothetical protein
MPRLPVLLRWLTVLCFAGVCAPSVNADYEPTLVHELLGGSELIVRGKIVELQKATYLLEVEECLVGENIHRGDRVEIVRFQDWPCAQRMTEYRVGQHLLLFAVRQDEKWRVMGAGCEGECLLAGETLYCRIPDLYELGQRDEKFRASKIPYDYLRELLGAYRACFEFVPAQGERLVRIRQLVSADRLAAFARKSTLHASLVTRTQADAKQLNEMRDSKKPRQP